MQNSQKLERIHLQYCKHLLGVRTQTQNNFVYGELGRYPLFVQRTVTVVKYWLKIVHSVDVKYIRHTYNMLLDDTIQNPGKPNWVNSVKQLLERLGFGDVWLYQNVGNTELFLFELKDRLKHDFVRVWKSELENSTRARSYILFADIKFHDYLDVINDK